MELTTILLILTYLTTLVFSVPIHDPKVKEDEHEAIPNEKESVRVVRNPKDSYLPNASNPTQFSFLQTKQQDYLKQRYAQQQQIDVQKIAKLRKNNFNKNPLDDSYLKYLEIPERTTVTKRRQERNVKEEHIPVPNKSQINRQDFESPLDKHIIYVNPKILRQILDFKAKRSTQIQDRSYKEFDTHSLNDIIGKNPHVQLESLKRILQQNQRNTFLPVMKTAQPFEDKDHIPITERTADIPNLQQRPNIQTSQAVTKETFERIQKQLDEASKYQVHNVLERAQQAAQAHVAAQHKAIEEAQRTILENVQKRLYDNPQALALVQPQVSDYTKHYSTPVPPTAQRVNYKTALTTVPSVIHNTVEPEEEMHSNVANDDESQHHNIRIIKVTPLPKHILIEPQLKHVVVTPKPQQFESNNVEHYAPHHLHQTIAQLQAEKAILQQINKQNKAILNRNKALVKFVGEKVQLPNEDSNSEKEAQPTVNSYQKLVLNHHQEDEVKKIDPEEENEDLQYAAKYAFGYRIKDNKEGSDFGHEEKRSGKSAEGSYHVVLPDGRRQKVEYYADDNGYHAKVTYENVAHH